MLQSGEVQGNLVVGDGMATGPLWDFGSSPGKAPLSHLAHGCGEGIEDQQERV